MIFKLQGLTPRPAVLSLFINTLICTRASTSTNTTVPSPPTALLLIPLALPRHLRTFPVPRFEAAAT